MAMRATHYAKSGDVHVAYQVFGSGPIDLVLAPGFVSQIENYWEHPDLARWLLRLGSFARVIMFDKRGTGLSDPVSEVPSLELRMDDVRAVMDAVGMRRAAQLAYPKAVRWRPCSPRPIPSGAGAGAVWQFCPFLLDYPRGT
jgi:alpha-beta hydrolase superfamily lysophospholipase